MFDPFEVVDAADREVIEENMVTIPIGNKIFGLDEGILMGIIVGMLIAHILGEL